MGFRIGVVCEGSHDFNVLSVFINLIIREFGETVDELTCLQPEVSATFQQTTGGWTQVRSWCSAQDGQGYRKHFDQPLFATSKMYDLLIVHLDGDVVQHCNAEPLNGLEIATMSVTEIIDALKRAVLESWLTIDSDHREKIIACIPVRHLESWLSAGIGPFVSDHEGIDMKAQFRAGPIRRVRGSWRRKYIMAAMSSAAHVARLRQICVSFQAFENDLRIAAEAA